MLSPVPVFGLLIKVGLSETLAFLRASFTVFASRLRDALHLMLN